ncbi:MAG: (Fe-S)-binding protein [Clostridia bacterium]|nr:(Fe-S)-binding protein [Clostridia bacterium]
MAEPVETRLLTEYYEKERSRVLKECIRCGLCYELCSVQKEALQEARPREYQDKVLKFLEGGAADKLVYDRGFSCLQCFKCTDKCPKGLNPLLINELIKWDYQRKNIKTLKYNEPADPEVPQRVAASIQVNEADYAGIFTKSPQKKSKYVFFPGCNVYFQPDKILSALDILDLLTDDYAFLPGLNNCCGRVQLFNGDVDRAGEVAAELLAEIAAYEPETLIVWCPTCLCNFAVTIAPIYALPYKVVSLPQFIAENLQKLQFKQPVPQKITLHEACKSALSGLDMKGPREILKSLPRAEFTEMARHAESTVCCGLGALNYDKQILARMRDERMEEAADTGAAILANVCHACHKFFLGQEHRFSYDIVNYITLLAQALGIEREDKLKAYIKINDQAQIKAAAKDYPASSSFSPERIDQVIREYIMK